MAHAGVQLFFPLAGFIMSIISDRAMNCEPQTRERASELLELISNLGLRRQRWPGFGADRTCADSASRRVETPSTRRLHEEAVGGLFSILMLRQVPREYPGNSRSADRVPAFPTDEALDAWKRLGLRNFTDVFTL